ncbi:MULTISPECIES: catalase/peroxidase HPI [Prauserella salsuginis group]|uniref:Catalase-peroxidase n=2 Tax=Prauserella salsuginis group TaxID=2893672 RepID=A0A839XIX0_9PSEU|nr:MULTISPECIES: catalase/peroxidase HPI [Prauserella salsuginis group]MBB3663892.1 catalase-peroxidase [Prauserella sediminis]MCR3718056.1 catalase-peroxidase [Prauserella flava]MCR3732611.1 catalase-peroxidase [Prauserella salsuginis]
MPENPDTHVYRTYDKVLNEGRPNRRRNHPTASGNVNDWWPCRVDLTRLRRHGPSNDPLGADFDYAEQFNTLDLDELARDVDEVLTTPQDWWPADFGHYGPLVLRMAWHAAGSYRMSDGRGGAAAGMQRFAPLNSWPDNRNLDKARRLLWPVKQKYGRKISWADLMIFAGNRALESMGFKTFGFGGGRGEVWEPDDAYWGPEHKWLADERHSGRRDLDEDLAASDMGLIYVDPQGPATNPDPVLAARDIRQTFQRMGMDDEETVALIAGGHTFGKTHGLVDPVLELGPEPEAAPLQAQGLGWANSDGTGKGPDTTSSGLEGMWTRTPVTWDHTFFETLFEYKWDIELSPAGLWQWIPSDGQGEDTVPDPYDPDTKHHPVMLTTDLSLQEDSAYEPISRRFLEHPDEFEDAFARAWFKLTHLDMGPVQRYLGPLVPDERLLWQDPVPEPDHEIVDADDIAALKRELLASGLTVEQLVTTAWASASTYRDTDKRGGANGARIRLEPQCTWPVNEPEQLCVVLDVLDSVRERFNATCGGDKRISLADLIVLGGCVAVEYAAAAGGYEIEVPFRPGRTDATQEWTDVGWSGVLQPKADGFRNYVGPELRMPPEHAVVERADLLTLSPPEMTVLIGGLRVLGANHRGSRVGVLTPVPGVLTNDFFVNLLDMRTEWVPSQEARGPGNYEGRDRDTGEVRWFASRVDLLFGSNSELRALSEVYACEDASAKFVRDFVSAWVKVMELDRFDLR